MPTVFLCSKVPGGHRRAGLFVPPQQSPETEVTDEQLKLLKADPGVMIMVKAEEPDPVVPPAPPIPPAPPVEQTKAKK